VRQTKHSIITILAGCIFFSCSRGSVDRDSIPEMASLRVEVSLADSSQTAKVIDQSKVKTRSFSDQTLSDLHVFVCQNNGEMTGHGYVTGSSISSIITRSGKGCTVYALTNTGDDDLSSSGGFPITRSEIKEMVTPDITILNDIQKNDHLIMFGSTTLDIEAGSNSLSNLSVARLAAKNTLNITCQNDIVLVGYTVGNLPVKSWYVPRPNTNEASSTDQVVGDDAVHPNTSTDFLSTGLVSSSGITTGSTPQYALTFYMYENRRGGRIQVGGTLGDETDETQKAIYAPDHATYVDLFVNANGTLLTHRLYLGGTPYATNYNVKRNSFYNYNITINATDGLLVSNVSVQNWDTTTGGEANM